jgi:acyl carrier protein
MTEMNPDFRQIVLEAIAAAAAISAADLVDETNLLELGLDSLEFSEILINVEDAVGEQVSMDLLDKLDDVGDIITVADLCDFLSAWTPARFAEASVDQV